LITIFLVGHNKSGHKANQKNPDYEDSRSATGLCGSWESHAERKANRAVSSTQNAIKFRQAIIVLRRKQDNAAPYSGIISVIYIIAVLLRFNQPAR
jgi:hypothetical protein